MIAWLRKFKSLLIGMVFVLQAPVYADDVAVIVRSGVMCSSVLDMHYYYSILYKKFGQPIQKEGAYWFKAGMPFYGQTAEDVFIADGTTEWNFVGVVIGIKAPDLAETVKNTRGLGLVFMETNYGMKYTPYHSQNGSEILWFGEDKSKFLCKSKSNNNYYYNRPF